MDPRADVSLGNGRAEGKIGASRQGCLNGKKEITCGGGSTTEFLLSAVLPKITFCAAIPARNRLQLHISTHGTEA